RQIRALAGADRPDHRCLGLVALPLPLARLMRGWWWKLLAVVLLLYVVVVGLRTPLGPALVHVSIGRIAPGPISFEATGYNTHFSTDRPQVWLENDGQRWCAAEVNALSEVSFVAQFHVPEGFRANLTSLWASSATDGTVVLREAFYTEGRGDGIAEQLCTAGPDARAGFSFRSEERRV